MSLRSSESPTDPKQIHKQALQKNFELLFYLYPILKSDITWVNTWNHIKCRFGKYEQNMFVEMCIEISRLTSIMIRLLIL